MAIEITFIRHGETEANAAGIWQGQGDASLSQTGKLQSESLRSRIEPDRYDRVISSDLTRTVETAEIAGLDPVLDPAWREMDIGSWEGLSRAKVHERFPDEIGRLMAGDRDVAMGGGESWTTFTRRIDTAVEQLLTESPAGSRVLVMAHGGVIHAALAGGLGLRGDRRWPVARIRNTAITEVIAGDSFHLQVLNDARHAPVVTGGERDAATAALIRHAESEANRAGRWHGRTDGPLSEQGAAQGSLLAGQYDGVSRVFASPLRRTRETAEAFARAADLDVQLVDGVIEIDFGAWEGLTTSEIQERFPEEFLRVFEEGEDLPRGGSGETFADAGERLESTLRSLVELHVGERLAVFSHGGAIWALTARLLGFRWGDWRKLAMPSNVSTTHVRLDTDSGLLIDYNLPLL